MRINRVFCTRSLTRNVEPTAYAALARLESLLPDARICCLDQIHSARIVIAEDLLPGELPQADGIISTDPDKLLCVRTADCLPVLAWAQDTLMHAAIHAGWRGLAKKIIFKGIKMMQSQGAHSIRISIGPAIGPCCYEVQRDVIDALAPSSFHIEEDSIYLDLWQEAFKQSIEAGVQKDNIKIKRLCTSCNPDKFFSYRRDGNSTGRNISAIGGDSWLLPGLQAP